MYKRISDKDFANTLQKAVAGDVKAIFKIIDIYDGLILKHSTIDGAYNQECRDYIEDRIIKEIKKFKKI